MQSLQSKKALATAKAKKRGQARVRLSGAWG